jgi:hypothetical protein
MRSCNQKRPTVPGTQAALALDVRYVVSMFEHARQALMMALLPGPVGVL